MNWNSHSPKPWKIGTLRNLTRRAIMMPSAIPLDIELRHLRKVLCDVNQYPPQVTNKIIAEEVEKHQSTKTSKDDTSTETEKQRKIQLNLPYGGEKGQHLMRKLGKSIGKSLEGKVQLQTTYTPKKLESRFPIKGKTKLIHQHNLSYHISCANKEYKSHFVGPQQQRLKVTCPPALQKY